MANFLSIFPVLTSVLVQIRTVHEQLFVTILHFSIRRIVDFHVFLKPAKKTADFPDSLPNTENMLSFS